MHTTTPPPGAASGPTDRASATAAFLRAFDKPVRATPTAAISDAERLLWVGLVIEEALEFAEAMGVAVFTEANNGRVDTLMVTTSLDPRPGVDVDLVEAADALGDIAVVTEGAALTLGVPLDAVFAAIHATNMAKLGPDGRPMLGAHDRIVKPVDWTPPTAAITGILIDQGWDPDEDRT